MTRCRQKSKQGDKITKNFVEAIIEWLKEEEKIPFLYAWQIVLGAKLVMNKEPSLVEYKISQQQTVDAVGDT
jgi:serine/threonine-protein phosphatase 5